MHTPQDQQFYRRADSIEGQLSFCKICFQTVAKGPNEADLVDGERHHRCSGPPTLLPREINSFAGNSNEQN